MTHFLKNLLGDLQMRCLLASTGGAVTRVIRGDVAFRLCTYFFRFILSQLKVIRLLVHLVACPYTIVLHL